MSVTSETRSIPTVAQAIDAFLARRQNQRGTKELVSILQGARSNHVVGKRAAGPALARSEFGDLRFDRVSGADFAAWLHRRHPSYQAASTLKKGRSALRQLLLYAIAHNWADEVVLADLPRVSASPPRREWLRPEQIAAMSPLVTEDNLIPQQCFMWLCLLNTGLRPEELVKLQPRALNPLDATLTVIGKGHGDGKPRRVPLDPQFQEAWLAYVRQHKLRPESWLFPVMQVRFVPGERMSYVHEVGDASKHCTTKAVRTAIAKVRDLAEEEVRAKRLAPTLLPPFALTPKVLRRTYACTHLIASALLGPSAGMDLRSLQQAMGHESLETTAIYLSDVSDYINRHRRPANIGAVAAQLAELAEVSPTPEAPGAIAA